MKKTAVFLIFFTVFAASADNLNLNLKKGDHFTTDISSIQTVIRDIDGNQTQVDNSTEMTLSFKVTGSDGATYTIEMQYRHITIASRGAGWEYNYDSNPSTDSENRDSYRMSIFYQTLLTQPITLVVDRSTGAIKSMSGWDKLGTRLAETLRQGTKEDRKKLADMFISSIKNGMVNGGPDSLFLSLPEKTIQKGAQWFVQNTIPLLSGLSIQTTYKVTDISPDRAKLSVSSSLSTSSNATPAVSGFTKTQYKLNGTQKGTLVVDRKTGWVTQAHMNQELDGTLNMIDMGISFPVTLSGKTDMRSRQDSGSTRK